MQSSFSCGDRIVGICGRLAILFRGGINLDLRHDPAMLRWPVRLDAAVCGPEAGSAKDVVDSHPRPEQRDRVAGLAGGQVGAFGGGQKGGLHGRVNAEFEFS